MRITFFYDNGRTFTANGINNYVVDAEHIFYEVVSEYRGIGKLESFAVPKADVAAIKVTNEDRTTIIKLKRSAKVTTGVEILPKKSTQPKPKLRPRSVHNKYKVVPKEVQESVNY